MLLNQHGETTSPVRTGLCDQTKRRIRYISCPVTCLESVVQGRNHQHSEGQFLRHYLHKMHPPMHCRPQERHAQGLCKLSQVEGPHVNKGAFAAAQRRRGHDHAVDIGLGGLPLPCSIQAGLQAFEEEGKVAALCDVEYTNTMHQSHVEPLCNPQDSQAGRGA